ncbi:MAG: hypothetical protein M0002_12990 [Rhodospirillales bacterium]|nr:hypothetical protein [Rhodospirillales bacterium]
MIKGAFLGITIFVVLWLAVWVARAERGKPSAWTPFDMREPKPPPDGALSLPRRRARALRTSTRR